MTFDEFRTQNIDPDEVYDAIEVEEIAKKAWDTALRTLHDEVAQVFKVQKLRATSMKDQCEAKLETFLDEHPQFRDKKNEKKS